MPKGQNQQSNNHGNNQPAAYVSSHGGGHKPIDSAWILDSGTSHYLTGDLNNQYNSSKFGESEDIVVGNGGHLFVKHINLNYPKYNLHLHDILHALRVASNLLFVSRLFANKDLFIELYSNCCFVQDIGRFFFKALLNKDCIEFGIK